MENTKRGISYAGVYILDAVYSADMKYTYYIPESLAGMVSIGAFVVVPFGGGNRRRVAVVWDISDKTDYKRTKPIEDIYRTRLSLDESAIALAEYMKSVTFCTIGDAVRTILPGLRCVPGVVYSINQAGLAEDGERLRAGYNDKKLAVLAGLVQKKEATLTELTDEFGDGIESYLKSFIKDGLLKIRSLPVEDPAAKEIVMINLAPEAIDGLTFSAIGAPAGERLTMKQESVIEYLSDAGETEQRELCERLSVGSSVIKTLEKRGLITTERRAANRDIYAHLNQSAGEDDNAHTLNEEQQAAYDELASLYDNSRPCAALLHGVTGSGKTHVLLALAAKVVSGGSRVIVLVPEIALTLQTITLFKSYFGSRAVVYHSALSAGEKLDTWKRAKSGEIDIVIGTRSAVFLPLPSLGLIIIDEEQEHTYKSESTPKYHARDMARFLCARHNAMLALASATPSVESYYKAKIGKYTLVSLSGRYGEAVLPQTMIIDMREQPPDDRAVFLSEPLKIGIASALERGEQVILFQNRRGYHTFLSCRTCGCVVMCPNCSVSLKPHAEARRTLSGERRLPARLICHYCGYTDPLPDKCPACAGERIYPFGAGTQKCEDDIAELFPGARIIRMDADTTVSKKSYDNIIRIMREREADILIGTQMVTKGHNFDGVTLVGVLSADQTLYLDDYRAGERAFSMITQVSGRAGRSSRDGAAYIQTYDPAGEIITLAAAQDYGAFYEKEIKFRRAAVFPPFCDICLVSFSGANENEAAKAADIFGNELRRCLSDRFSDVELILFGPFKEIIYKLNNRYRMRYVIKCRANRRARELFSELLSTVSKKLTRKVSMNIDINPNNI